MKRALIILCLCLLSISVSAQKFRFGVRSGATAANLVGLENTSPKAGFYGGATAEWRITPAWGLQTEAVFSMQGARYNDSVRDLTMWYDYNYLNIPLLLTCSLAEESCTVLLGVQMGLLLTQKTTYLCPSTSGSGMVSGSERFKSGDYYPLDGGLTVGFRYRPFAHFGIEGRYTCGMTQIHKGVSYKMNGYYYISVPDNRNSVIQVGLFYEF